MRAWSRTSGSKCSSRCKWLLRPLDLKTLNKWSRKTLECPSKMSSQNSAQLQSLLHPWLRFTKLVFAALVKSLLLKCSILRSNGTQLVTWPCASWQAMSVSYSSRISATSGSLTRQLSQLIKKLTSAKKSSTQSAARRFSKITHESKCQKSTLSCAISAYL